MCDPERYNQNQSNTCKTRKCKSTELGITGCNITWLAMSNTNTFYTCIHSNKTFIIPQREIYVLVQIKKIKNKSISKYIIKTVKKS